MENHARVVDGAEAAELERPVALLNGVAEGLDGMAASIPEPALAVPVGYFVDALRYTISLLPGAVTPDASAISSPQPDAIPALDPERVTRYLKERFGTNARADAVTPIAGGYSKHTTLVSATLEGQRQELVLRQVPEGQPEDTLVPEYELLRHAFSPELPIPEPLWVEPGANALGGPFFAGRKADGTTLGDVEGARSEVPESFCIELAVFMARLHAIDPSGLSRTPVLPMRSPKETHAAIDEMEGRVVTAVGAPSPELDEVLSWLRERVPQVEVERIVHGDVGLHNTLALEGRLTAVLDWERGHLGDPVEDLAYLRPSIEPVFPWERFLEHYTSAGGEVPDPDVEQFYAVWADTWRHIECVRLGEDFFESRNVPMMIAGFVLGPRFLASARQTAFGAEGSVPPAVGTP
jgi:aminoglycoside phosphotransferase (APT) family kinase protein